MNIVLPFEEQQLLQIFTSQNEPSKVYIVDGLRSLDNLQNKLCVYISNLNLTCDIDCSQLTYDQKVDLLDQYLNTFRVCDIKSLTETLLSVLLVYCDVPHDLDPCLTSIFTPTEIDTYIETHHDVLDRIMVCLYSVVALILQNGKDHNNLQVDIKFESIVDRYFMPINLVNLFKYKDLLLCYQQLQMDKVKYLKYQFETPIFNNKYLGDYVFVENNLLAVYMVNMFNGFV